MNTQGADGGLQAWLTALEPSTAAVVPVFGGGPSVGTSGVALAIAEAAAAAGDAVAVVDCADPARSGLAGATTTAGVVVAAGQWRVRVAARGSASVLRLAEAAVGAVPAPKVWLDVLDRAGVRADLVVVDTGWDPWNAMGPDEIGAEAFAWCTPGGDLGPARVRPVFVTRATLPGVSGSERVLQRYAAAGLASPVACAVVGQEAWPSQVLATAGVRLRTIADRSVFVPWDGRAALHGWDAEPLPEVLTTPWRAWVDDLAGRPSAPGPSTRRPGLPFRKRSQP